MKKCIFAGLVVAAIIFCLTRGKTSMSAEGDSQTHSLRDQQIANALNDRH